MKNIFKTLMIVVLVTILTTVVFADQKRDYNAVMVGIDDYPAVDSAIIWGNYNLRYCTSDVNDMNQALQYSKLWNNGLINYANTNDFAGNYNIYTTMKQTAQNTNKNGTFLFYFSGFGSNDGKLPFLVPWDGLMDSNNLISPYDLSDWLNLFDPSVHKIVIIDACFSGMMYDADCNYVVNLNERDKFVPVSNWTNYDYNIPGFEYVLAKIPNTTVLMACSPKEECQESKMLQNGVFTFYIVQGLGMGRNIGEADQNKNGSITASELFSYVTAKVSQHTKLDHPQLISNDIDVVIKSNN